MQFLIIKFRHRSLRIERIEHVGDALVSRIDLPVSTSHKQLEQAIVITDFVKIHKNDKKDDKRQLLLAIKRKRFKLSLH